MLRCQRQRHLEAARRSVSKQTDRGRIDQTAVEANTTTLSVLPLLIRARRRNPGDARGELELQVHRRKREPERWQRDLTLRCGNELGGAGERVGIEPTLRLHHPVDGLGQQRRERRLLTGRCWR